MTGPGAAKPVPSPWRAALALAALAVALPQESGLAATQADAGSVVLMKNYTRESGIWQLFSAPDPNPLAVQRTDGARCDASSEVRGWWSLCKGSTVYWGDAFRLETNARLRLKLRDGLIVLLPEVRDRESGRAWGKDGDIGLYSLEREGRTTIVNVERGVVIARRWRGSQEESFRMVASGFHANVTGTSWMLTVDADSVAELIVDVDDPTGKIVLTSAADADAYGAGAAGAGAKGAVAGAAGADTIQAFPGRRYRWKNGALLPGGVEAFDRDTALLWSDIIAFNADDMWEGGGNFPWVVVPAVAVPVVLCVILCGGDDDGGKTGTVTIPIP